MSRRRSLLSVAVFVAWVGAAACHDATPPTSAGPVSRIAFTADSFAVKQNRQLQLHAVAYDSNDQIVHGVALGYSVIGGAAAATTASGLVSGVKPGATIVEAHAGSVSATATVEVFGHPEGILLGSEPLGSRPFGVAISRDGVVYVTQADGGVARLDTNLTVVEFITVGYGPTGIVFAPDGQTAFVANQLSQNVGVIDVASDLQVRTIPIPADPFVPFVSPDGSKVFISSNTSMVYVADAATGALTDSIRVTHAPNGLSLHPDMSRVYVSTFVGGTVSEIDLVNNAVLRSWTPGGMPQDMVVTPDGSELFVANEQGWVNVYDLASGDAVDSIPLHGGGFGMALSPDQEHLYVSESNAGLVEVINIASRAIVHTIDVGGQPRRIAFTRHGGVAAIPNESGFVSFVR